MMLYLPQSCKIDKPLPAKREVALSQAGYSIFFCSGVEEVPEDFWQVAALSGDYFLQKSYLQLLEACPPSGMKFGYILFRYQNTGVGIAYCQFLEFRANRHIRQEGAGNNGLKQLIAAHLNFKVLVCGNMLLTGQHAYFFKFNEEQLAGALLREALEKVAVMLRNDGEKPDALLLKDIPNSNQQAIRFWEKTSFQQLTFQPNMVLPIADNWNNLDDYLTALTSKYRVRYRRARKKMATLSVHELNERQIRYYEQELYALYRNVADDSDFCMTYLHPHYFSALKAQARESFRLWAYFQGEQLVGFCTSLQNNDLLEAHFLGLDKSRHTEYQLYLNMLFDLIAVAVKAGVKELIFSRTALAIKSSVGAIPVPTSVFLTHPGNPVINASIPFLVDWLKPKDQWQARHPFREPLKEKVAGEK